MYILKVIPIAKGLPENYFSYFSKEKLPLGSLVKIKIRNRKLTGIVCEVNNIENEKINLKSQNFSLKKIESVIKENFIDENIFKSINELAILLGVRESDILENYIPDWIYDNPDYKIFKNKQKENKEERQQTQKLLKEKEKEDEREKEGENENYKKNENVETFINTDFNKRYKYYLEIIKENWKNKKSTIIFFPTINDLEFIKNILERSDLFSTENKEKIISFHSQKTKKDLKNTIKKIEYGEDFLILSTSSLFPFLIKEKINLETVILEKENSYNYFTHTSKRQIDAREIIKKITNDLKLKLILGGNILSLESYLELSLLKTLSKKNKINTSSSHTITNTFEVIDLIKEKETEKKEEKISKNKEELKYNKVYFSNILIKDLEKLKNEKTGKVFLYTKRKGLFTETICNDCNTIFKCTNCDKPYTLFKKENNKIEERYYICSNCKNKIQLKKSENLLCENCGGHRMNTIGIGAEGIEENLKEIGWKTFLLDTQNVKTKKQIIEIMDAWQKEDLSILIGTDLVLNFISEDMICDLAAIISLDSLFSIPEINIDEKIFNIALEMKEKINSKEKILIQTRMREQNIWEYIENEDILGFLENEIENRKILNLPPFTKILKFKLEKKEIKIKNEIEKIFENICEEEMQPLQSFGQLPQGKHLLQIPKYNKNLLLQAKENRKNMTETEKYFWYIINNDQTNFDFTRQKVIGNFILDFYSNELLLGIEIDGNIHDKQKEYDQEREMFLNSQNIKILRFKNEEVKNTKKTDLIKIFEERKSEVFASIGEAGEQSETEGVKTPTISWHYEKKSDSYIGVIVLDKNLWEKEILENNKKIIVPTNFAKKINTLLIDFNLEINPQSVF